MHCTNKETIRKLDFVNVTSFTVHTQRDEYRLKNELITYIVGILD